MPKLDDNSLMPWGKHKGEKLANVPDKYLLWLYKEKKATGDVLDYIEDNMDVIKMNLGIENEEFDDE